MDRTITATRLRRTVRDRFMAGRRRSGRVLE